MTDEQKQKKYLDDTGINCPNCGESEKREEAANCYLPGELVQEVECEICHATWTDTYVLQGFSDLKTV